MGNPVADPNHPFWDVMKVAIDRGDGTEAGAGPAIDTDTGMDEAGGDGDVQGYADGGVVRSVNPDTGVPRYTHQGSPGITGAIGDAVRAIVGHPIESAQRTARDETSDRVNSNERKAVEGYADGGYVGIPAADDTTRPSITSALGIGSALGHNVHEENLAAAGREAKDAALEPDTTPDPNADKPSLLSRAGNAVMHPIQAVRQAVTDLADFLGHPDNNHDTVGKGIIVPAAALSMDAPNSPGVPAENLPGGGAVPSKGPGAAPQPAGAAPAAAPAPASPEQAVVKAGAAAADQPVPTNIQEAAAQAKANPSEPVGKAHSLGPDFYEGVQQRAIHAAHLAAKAGLDPKQVYDNSMAMAISHMQGQVMRSYGAAYNAFQAGDMPGVEKALRDANFYMPDGKDLKFQHATQADVTSGKAGAVGDLMVRNPFMGMPGHEKDKEWIPINPQQISLMATAALHPENFHTEIAGMVKAETEARKDMVEGQAKLAAAHGGELRGQAAVTRAEVLKNQSPSVIFKNIAAGDKDERWVPGGNTKGQPKIPLGSVAKFQGDAVKAVDNAVMGQSRYEPTMVKDEKGNDVMNLSPGAGRQTRDPTRVDPLFQHLPPAAVNEIKAKAASIAAANAAGTVGGAGTSAEEAAQIAARIYQYEHGYTVAPDGQVIKGGANTGRHIVPGTKAPNAKFERDVIPGVGPDKGILHVWMGDHWANIYLQPNIDDRAPGVDTGGGSSGENPADNATAEENADLASDESGSGE